MTLSIRNKYFLWLLMFIVLTYAMIFSSFFLIELHESHSQGTPFSEEYTELFAVLGVMMITAPFSLILAWGLAGQILKPLKQVLQTAEDIRRGNLDERIPPMPQTDELSKLAQTINEAFDRYASAVKRLDNFSSDASHQLRTPLAAIKTSAEVSLQNDRLVDDYKESLGAILEQTEKLNQTIDQLLKLSRLDSSLQASYTKFNLSHEVAQWTDEARMFIDDRTLELHIDDQDKSANIIGNKILLKEVFSNLLNNALAVTPPEGRILTRISFQGRGLMEWRMEDSGPGIPDDERERIFDRFYRGNTSMHPGSGLGLAIVKQIIILHNGSIHAEKSQSLGGAAICISLPIAPA